MADSDPSAAGGITLAIEREDPISSAGERLANALRAVIEKTGRARLAIPGGSALGAAVVARDRLGEAWKQIALTWVDERCVPLDDPDSNRGAALRLGLAPRTVPRTAADTDRAVARNSARNSSRAALLDSQPESVVPLYLDGEDPNDAVGRVARALEHDFGNALDVVLLGMGEDGHIASLFPRSSESNDAAPTDARVQHITNSPKPPALRMTLTRRMLATAKSTILVALGEPKREPLRRLLAGDASLPAHGLTGLVVVTDLEIARPKARTTARPRIRNE